MIEAFANSGVSFSRPLPVLDPRSRFEPPCVIQATLAPRNFIEIGAFTGVYGGRLGHCEIGRYCSIADGVDIASDQHPTEWISTSMVQYVENVHGWRDWLEANGSPSQLEPRRFRSNARVHIGNDVWVGKNAIIRSGVTVGDGAIIGAGAVVTRDVEPYAIVAGVPARVVRKRFDDQLVESLLGFKWWQYSLYDFRGLNFSDPSASLEMMREQVDRGFVSPYSPGWIGVAQ